MADTNISEIPIVAFFGTKGGVGKTTVSNKFTELIAQSEAKPNILVFDFDVDHAGMGVTLLREGFSNCKTMHDYIEHQIYEIEEAIKVSFTTNTTEDEVGDIYLIPASARSATNIFEVMAGITPSTMFDIINSLINSGIRKYNISCVIIDCGPVINPYTAAAVHIASHNFLIGQNEPISYNNFESYTARVRNFYQNFNPSKVKFILNKVRGNILNEKNVFFKIPFVIDIIDVTEGIENISMVRMLLFDNYIRELIKKAFNSNENLQKFIPQAKAVIPHEYEELIKKAPLITGLKELKLYKQLGKLLFVGIGIFALFFILKSIFPPLELNNNENSFPTFSDNFLNLLYSIPNSLIIILSIIFISIGIHFRKLWKQLMLALFLINENKEEAILRFIHSKKERKILDRISKLSTHLNKIAK